MRVNTVHPTQVDTDMIQNDVMYRLFVPDAERPPRACVLLAGYLAALLGRS